MGLQLDGEVGIVCVVLEIVFFQHGVIEATGEAASLDVLDLRTGKLKYMHSLGVSSEVGFKIDPETYPLHTNCIINMVHET